MRHAQGKIRPRDERQLVATPAPDRLRLVQTKASIDPAEFGRVVVEGLSSSPKWLACRYLYDEEGSHLFEAICNLPEYYLTRAETEILQEHATEIASLFRGPLTLAELGSGSAVKTRLLISAFLAKGRDLRYAPVDISHTMLESSSRALLDEYPRLTIVAVAGEYREGLRRLSREADRPKLVLWLGSNVGNLHREDAREFLRSVRRTLGPADRLLVGIDLRKDPATIQRAYDDREGVTARFSLNLLRRINRELGGRFDLSRFQHRAVYNDPAGRIEIDLISLVRQVVPIEALGMEVSFEAGEPIRTEYSYKYSIEEIQDLALASELRLDRQWFDAARRFSVNLFSPSR